MDGESYIVLAMEWIDTDRQLTSCSVQPATASFAFEVFSLLMGDENLQVIEITLTCDTLAYSRSEMDSGKHTVVTPGSGEQFLDVWVIALLLTDHYDDARRAIRWAAKRVEKWS